ncbi:hypothetical protein [Aquimarina sp. MMG016]|uniref:hypothetical protein n=1 Tax=Aquimarina sp. MMG016 TaxID=2822690 RepID=UPI001B39EF48|nr:hypothetical protein [Aquimarina sp. MMG016]MBQ4822267.1 hypothetical protein [Aquimarina sp. MMG016]
MIKTLPFILTLIFYAFAKAQVDPELLLDLKQGTTAQIAAIPTANIETGAMVFDISLGEVFQFNGTKWVQMLSEDSGWKIDGNTDTDDTTDFIGTTDAQDLILKANDSDELRISASNGQLLVNEAPNFNNHPLVIRASGVDVLAFQNSSGTPEWHWNLLGNGLNFVESNVADYRMFLENGGNLGINTDNPEATLDINPVSNEVPLRVRPNTTTPTGANRGEFYVDNTDGLLYAYDQTRGKWLSVDRTMIGWGRNSGNASNEYLRQFNGAQSNNNGWRMIRDGTITAITVQSNNVDTFDIEIENNDNTTPIFTFTITNAEGGHNNTVNVDFNEGDFLQCFLPNVAGGVAFPQVLIEIAWRK